MSGRVRKQSGPIRATLPMCSLLKCACPLQRSPEQYASPIVSGQRSPGAQCYKAKPHSIKMRRTASLDALTGTRGLGALLQVDKATQTDDGSVTPGGPSEDKIVEKMIRQRLHRVWTAPEHSVSSQTTGAHLSLSVCPIELPVKPMRSSIEGLNQEIERLVLCPGSLYSERAGVDLFRLATPEGHRAPLADLLHSVDTQTPLQSLVGGTWVLDDDQDSSPGAGAGGWDQGGSSPEQLTCAASLQGASPRINRFLAREPPDGCEKVSSRPTDMEVSTEVFKPCESFQLRPSRGSAFQPLQSLHDLTTPSEL